MGDRFRWRLSLALSVVVALAWASGPVGAADAERDETTKANAVSAATDESDVEEAAEEAPTSETAAGADSVPFAMTGLRVVVDPVTGRIVGEPRAGVSRSFQVDRELLLALSRSHEGLIAEQRPDGTMSIDLQGRFQSASVVTIDENGELVFGHVVVTAGEQGSAETGEPEQ